MKIYPVDGKVAQYNRNLFDNYSPKARWLSGNIHRDEVEVNIPR